MRCEIYLRPSDGPDAVVVRIIYPLDDLREERMRAAKGGGGTDAPCIARVEVRVLAKSAWTWQKFALPPTSTGHSFVCEEASTRPASSMSGKDFYEDDTGDASKYYRPDAPAQASFFSGAPPAAAGGAPGVRALRNVCTALTVL